MTAATGCRGIHRTSFSFPAKRASLTVYSLLIVLGGLPGLCPAAESIVHEWVQDTKLYVTAPVRWDERDWLQFGGSLAAIAAAHEYDSDVRNHFLSRSTANQGTTDTHSTDDALPVAAMLAGTWALALVWDDRSGYEEGRTMLEAGGLSALSTEVFKYAAGRRRPSETSRVDDWSKSGSSFPSAHVSVTFAVGTVLAESGSDDFRWLRRFLGYGLAAGTGYLRVEHHQHWLSDTVAGAALGLATGQFAVNRRKERDQRLASVMLLPSSGGVTLTFAASF